MNWLYTILFLSAPLISGGVAFLISWLRKKLKKTDKLTEELSVYGEDL